ncbi:hypothetical protein [Chromohalobacter canadensis]|uniref:hypothetical protein n=1 Tax=Chromohalobacter canadensis TaxID=141389 RepID=UPI001FF1A41E|nr:hypothetical protein [Chromohalobacter canadensis]MCK0769209.1 hypothetical protein [Chromohalobacter canadensis]
MSKYYRFSDQLPPVGTPIICLAQLEGMPERVHPILEANAMYRATLELDGQVYHRSHETPGLGGIEGNPVAWKICYW